jgi:DNA-binding IclR family transcriptional regulator
MKLRCLFYILRAYQSNYRILRNSNLSKKIGVSLNTLQNAKNELIKQGWLVVHRLSSANRYTLKLRLPKNRVKLYPKIWV